VIAGALTGVAFLDDREKDLSVIGTLGNSVPGKNDVVLVHMVLALSALVKLLLQMALLLTVE
jgi:hypothetical protein